MRSQNLRRAIAGHETTNAVRLELARSGLFSSASDRSLLVYGTDFNKMGWSAAQSPTEKRSDRR